MSNSESEQYDLLDRLADEFAARFRRGERPALKEYTDRYPGLAADIRELFPAMVKVEQVEGLRQGDEEIEKSRSRSSPPKQIGDYRILGEIGRGGMGVVYEAEQVSLGRRVALKVLLGQVGRDRMTVERFRREARAAARLHHTNIVPVFEVGQDEDVRFYAMQLIQGLGLDDVIVELRRLRNRAGSHVTREGLSDDCSRRPDDERGRHGSEATTLGDGVAVSEVLQYILNGRFDHSDRVAELPEASPSALARALAGGLATAGGSNSHRSRTSAEPMVARTEARGESTGPEQDWSREPGFSPVVDPRSGSTTLPGGTQLSSAESGRQAFFRSLAQIGQQIADGLAYAHARGIVHRDIKPSNLLLDTEGVVWITDFGLAKGEDEGLTVTGDILGTLRYISPERFRGEGDARADVYALGLTLYELLTLHPPFDSSDRLRLIELIKTHDPQKPRTVDARIPRDLETIVMKAIEKEPGERYQSAAAMGEDLRRFLADEPIHARQVSAGERYWRWARRNPAIAVLGGVLTIVLILVTFGSLGIANRFAISADRERKAAHSERLARQDASRQAKAEAIARAEADQSRGAAEQAKLSAQAETYRALLSEVKALRAARQPGWRDTSLAHLARLAVMPTPRRDLVELRTEVTATLGTPDIRRVTRIELSSQDQMRSIAFSPDGQTFLTASHKVGLDFWDLRRQRHASHVDGLDVTEPAWRFGKAVYLARDQGLALATQDHGVVFMDGRGIRTSRAPLTQGASKPLALAVSTRGQEIAVGWTDGGGITVHDMVSGTLVRRFDGFDDAPFAISPDGRWFARQESADVVLYPIRSREPRVVLGRHDRFRTLAFSSDGALLAGACYDHTTVLWDVARRKQFGTLRGHRQRVINVAFSPDGEWIATTSGDYTTRIWETRTGQTLATLPGSGDMGQVAWSPDGNCLAVITYWFANVFIYRIAGRHDVRQWLTGNGAEAVAVASHPHREQFTTIFANGELLTVDAAAARPEHCPIGKDPGQGTALAFSADGKRLATGSWSVANAQTILVRNVESAEIICQIQSSHIPTALALDGSGQRLASIGGAGNLVVWDLATRKPLREFATNSSIKSICFLDGDHRLVTHDNDSILICNLQTGAVERRATLPGGILRLVVDGERRRLVLAFKSGAICSLSLSGLTPGHRIDHAHRGSVACLALSPDGRFLATGGEDHRIVLRDALTFAPLLEFPEWTSTLRDLAFDSASRHLAIVGTDSDLELCNIAALHDGLTDLGLAWDQLPIEKDLNNAPAENRTSPTAEVVVIRPGKLVPPKKGTE